MASHPGTLRRSLTVTAAAFALAAAVALAPAPAPAAAALPGTPHRQRGVAVHRARVQLRHHPRVAAAHATAHRHAR